MDNKSAIVIPLDGSETATVALGAAQAMASITDSILYIVHVNKTRLTENQLAKETKIIDKLKIKNCSIKQIVSDNSADEILHFTSSIDTKMIVMSTHGKTFNVKYLLGSVTTNVVQRAICPVMLIRPGSSLIPDYNWKPDKMLVPLDGTPAAASIMVQVFGLAELTSAVVDVLSIGIIGERPPSEIGTIRTPMYLDHPRYDWPAWSKEFVERFFAQKPPEVKLNLFEREGGLAQTIRQFAAENKDNLIVMGWHGQFGEGRALIVKELLQTVELPIILIWSRE